MNGTRWSLAAIQNQGEDVAVALLPDGEIVSIDVLPVGISPIQVLRRWEEFAPVLRNWNPANAERLEGVRLVAPIRYPSKLICIGVNFFDHREEMDSERDPEGKVVV